jgi:peptidoglycan/LPS O-acetylase OafA/YrhL
MPTPDRLHALDAVRAFALLLGVAFHAAIPFIPGLQPGLWATVDSSPSSTLAVFTFVSHIFRMSLFFFIAGFFARMLFQRQGMRGFWRNRFKRILLPLVAGWLLLFPSVSIVWIWGFIAHFGKLPEPSRGDGSIPLLHLWFLYLLLLLYGALLAARQIVLSADRTHRLRTLTDRFVHGVLNGYWGALILCVPLGVALLTLPKWTYPEGIPAPDTSLIPNTAAVAGYGTAMIFGWLVHRQLKQLPALAARWRGHAALAALTSLACWWIQSDQVRAFPLPATAEKTLYVVLYGFALWSWIFALTGFALRHLSKPSPVRRYVADASYYIYLAHLPIVVAFNVLVSEWAMHWTVKYPLVVAASLLILFASYHLLVRPTVIGQVLNGKKYPLR